MRWYCRRAGPSRAGRPVQDIADSTIGTPAPAPVRDTVGSEALAQLAAIEITDAVCTLTALRSAPRGDGDNTYRAGVKAAMDVVRRLGFPYADTGADDDGGTGADE